MAKKSVGKSYLVEVEPGRPAGDGLCEAGPAYRAALHKEFKAPDKTLFDNFQEAVSKYGAEPCLGRRVGEGYQWLTYQEADAMAAAVASGMMQLGVEPRGRCCIFSPNCPEWMLTMQACNRQSIACVPLYDTLGDDSVEYIINHSESSIVFVSAAKLHVLAKAMPKALGVVKDVVYWGEPASEQAAAALQDIQSLGVPVHAFQEVVELGRERPAPPVPPSVDDICTIFYTSGSTGTPKAVPLMHRAVATEVVALAFWFERVGVDIGVQSRHLSFLPLSHVYQRCMEETFLHLGVSIGYWGADIHKLAEDIKACQPTIFCAVPRVYERFYNAAMEKLKVSGLFKRMLFNFSFNRKLAALKAGNAWDEAAPRLDNLVFKAISKQMLGGSIKLLTSGGAPLARHIEDFMRVTSCAQFIQGYGLTETCAATFVTHPNEPDHFYSVGPPQPNFLVRLEAIPEMGYDPAGSPPRGEVLVKGISVAQGYMKDEEETRKALDAEGWFHTGDVGELTATGALRIIDRKKNIFKLSQGEYIAVEKIEGVLQRNPFIEQLWVYGCGFRSCLVAVVVPNKAKLEAWAQERNITGSFAELCANDQVSSMLLHEMAATGRKGGLKGFELPKAVFVDPSGFSVENDTLTPTFKLRRPQLLKKYGPQVDTMYARLR